MAQLSNVDLVCIPGQSDLIKSLSEGNAKDTSY